jgi:hypothetical protein
MSVPSQRLLPMPEYLENSRECHLFHRIAHVLGTLIALGELNSGIYTIFTVSDLNCPAPLKISFVFYLFLLTLVLAFDLNHLRLGTVTWLDLVFLAPFIIANYYAMTGIPDCAYNSIMLVYISLGYVYIFAPVICIFAIFITLPCISRVAQADSEKLLQKLPTFEFRDGHIASHTTNVQSELVPILQHDIDPHCAIQIDPCDAACAICLSIYESGDCLRKFNCSHHFHTLCIDVWLRKRSTCPLCIQNILV